VDNVVDMVSPAHVAFVVQRWRGEAQRVTTCGPTSPSARCAPPAGQGSPPITDDTA
jgi:hypothetical protein